jgi:hypothetical protein
MVIGHSDTADLALDDRFVSRRHAMVSVDPSGQVTIQDLNSTGGTFVNDERLDGPRVLRAGDRVRFADLKARFEHGDVEVAQTEIIEAAESAPEISDSPDGDHRYVVSGRVTWPDGSPAADVIVRAVDQDLRREQPLGSHAPRFEQETRTDDAGCYEIRYRRTQFKRAEIKNADLIVRVLDANGAVVTSSPTTFNAPAEATIDLALSGAVAGQPSEYDRLVAVLSPLLHDADPPEVTSLNSTDLDFLAGETGQNRAHLTALLDAVSLYQDATAVLRISPIGAAGDASATAVWTQPATKAITSPDLLVPAFYGLLREGLSADWAQLLQSGESVISSSLMSAVTDGIVPASVGQDASQIAVELAGLAAKQMITGTGGSSTAVSALLGAASLSSAQQQTLVTAAMGATGTPQEFWASLPSQPGFDAATVAHLQLTLQLGLLTGNNVPLVQALLAQRSVSSVKDLVSMDAAAWTQLLSTPIGGQSIPVPAGVPGATAAEQLQNYAQYLRGTIQSIFPNETVAHLVATGAISTDPTTQAAIGQFFTNSPDFDIRTTRITSYVAANGQAAFAGIPAATHPAVISELQRLQRAFQISVSADSMTTLLRLGLHAAHLVADIPPQSFTDRFADALGGTGTAEAIYQRATYVNARNVGLIVQLNDAVNGVTVPGLTGGTAVNGGSAAKDNILQQLPDLTDLFGALDPCACDQCTSVISPAAYLVDLLQFLGNSKPNEYRPLGTPGNTPLDVLIGGGRADRLVPIPLLGRRPDLQHLKLTCENTDTELPYIDLVNEVMESYILYNGPSQFAAHDTGDTTTTIELDASPQYALDGTRYSIGGPLPAPLSAPDPLPLDASSPPGGPLIEDGPYVTLANTCYPFTLPFNEPIAVARTYLQWLGTSRYQVMHTFQTSPGPAAAIDAEYLHLDPYLYQLLTGTTITGQPAAPPPAAALYGYPSDSPSGSWEPSLASIPAFLQQTGIQTTDLIALLQTRFANPAYPLGPDRAFFNELPFSYFTLMTLVNAGFNIQDPAVLAADPTIAADLSTAGIEVTGGIAIPIRDWWQRNPNLAQILVIYCPDGSCDLADASISQLSGLGGVAAPPADRPPPGPHPGPAPHPGPPPSPVPPTDTEFETLQAFIRLWRVLGWSMADLDRAFTALGVTAVTSGTAALIPATFIHDLAQIAQLQATLNPPALQVLFALWGDLDPNGDDSLYVQLFANPAALPNDPAFAPSPPDGAVLQDTAQTITGHVPALLAGLQVTAGDLALIRADAGLVDLAPAAGDVIVGGGLTALCTVSAVSGSGPYTVTASQEIPAGTNVTFTGGPAGVWTATGVPAGASQMTLTLTAGSAPQTGDLVLGGGLAQPLRITAVTGAGPYTVTTSEAIPAAGTFAGGPTGVWAGTASPSGGTSTMSLTLTPWPLTLPNVSLLYRYAALAQALGMSIADFITLKTLAALDPFASPDATIAFTKTVQQLQQSNFTASQLAYLYQDVSAPPAGLAPQPATLQLLAKGLRDGLAQIAAQCTIAPDPKGILTASTVTQLVSKTAAAATVALINGTAAYTAPLAALPLVYAWTGTASPPGSGNQMTLVLTTGSAPQPGDAMVGGGEQFTLTTVSVAGYAVMVSQAVPAGTGVTFAGGPGGAWLGTASPDGTDQITLTVTAGPAPQAGDTITGGSVPQPCTITTVSGNGPYTITASQPVPAGTGVMFAGGPGGPWLATASPGGTDQMTLTVTAGPAPRASDAITGGGLPQPSTVITAAASGYLITTTSQLIPAGTGVTFSGGNLARLDGSGNITGIDPARTPAEVGAKLSYNPTAGTLTYKGAMTSQEQTDLLALSADPGWQAAITSLHGQPEAFLADNLAPLLDDPGAPAVLLDNTASLDGNLNPVLVDATGHAQPDPAQAASTAIAWKFAYLLGELLPYLQNTLSHTLVKQTITDAFTLDPALTSLLLEQILTAPGAPPPSPPPPVITSLLALGTPGATATYYATTDLSGPPMAPPVTVAGTSFDLSLANQHERIPAGAQSASFAAWLEVPSSNTFTFSVTTNGIPKLFAGDPGTQLNLQEPTPGRYVAANSVALTAGGFTYVVLQITSLPPGQQGTATLSWQSPGPQAATAGPAAPSPQGASIPNTPIAGAALLPDAVYQAFGPAYIRIQKAALVASQFALTAAEIQYLTDPGAAPPLIAGFDLNALPFTPGAAAPAGTAAALFAVWLRLYAYTTLRNSLPKGSVTLLDLFAASTFGAAATLVPQVTGWPQEVTTELLTAFFPALTPASPNSLTDEITLTAMQACVNLAQQTGASPAQLFSWAQEAWTNPPPATPQEAAYAGLQAVAEDIQNTTAANYDAQAWPAVAEQLNNTLRASRRDALVSYLMGQLGYTDPNQLFELLLIDPEMGPCMQTSRIRQALNSVQLFVQRCLLGLEKNDANPAVSVDSSQIDATTWRTWMSTYATWAANREVFLWPENWLLPSLRDDQTEIFQAFASSLQQGTITDQTVSTAFLTYLQGLEQIDRLDIRCVFKDDTNVLHVFARTWHDPKVYFYRRLVGTPGGTQTWTPWQQVSADIQGDFLIPVFWENKLRLIWPVFTQQTYTPPASPVTGTSSGGKLSGDPGAPPEHYWQITLAWSDFYQGAWQPKRVSADFLVSVCWSDGQGDFFFTPRPPQETHTFKARIDDTDLVVDTFYRSGTTPVLLGEFRFSACGDTVTVGYLTNDLVSAVSPPSWLLAPSPDLSASQPASAQLQDGAQLLEVPYADPYNNGARQETETGTPQILQLLAGGFGDAPWPVTQVVGGYPPASKPLTYLNQTPSRFELRYSQQHWQFAMQEPFFYQDAQRTFFVAAGSGLSVVWWVLINANNIDLRGTVLSLAGSSYVPLKPLKPVPDAGGNALAAAPPLAAPGARARNAIATAPAPTTEPATLAQATGESRSPLVNYTGVSTANWGSLKYQPSSSSMLINGLLFQTHRHPYVCQLIESLVAAQGQSQSGGGIDGLLNLANQNLSNGFDFFTYKPDADNVLGPPPTETVDFTPTGAYSVYNWELFFHAPLLVALTLSQNGQYEDADTWFRYIFDPTSPSPYWQVQPFTTSVPETLVQLMNDVNDDSSSGQADAVAQVADWYSNPFQPFVIARSRIGAFQKYVFMAYLDNLIAWADQLYGQVDSIESINQATQLYVLASDLLGQLPEQIPAPHPPVEPDYASIQGKLDAFSNFSETLENEFPYAGPVTSDPQSRASGLLGLSKTLFFCVPQNQQLLQYWSTVAGRLYNIRHCLNIQGVPQQLALFQPPANPLLLIEAEAEGIDPGSVLADVSAPLPNYRFSHLIQRAAELASTCQAFGRQFLDALEKNDAEGLALLRATQETQILTLMTDMKQQQVTEAQANVTALSASRAVAVTRYNYYQLLLGAGTPAAPAVGATIGPATVPTEPPQSTGGVQLISEEASELSLSDEAAQLHAVAGVLQTLASIQAMSPTISAGTAFEPFGTGGNISVSFGGSNLASSIEAVVHGLETVANYLTYQAWSAGKMGGYFRRQQEWALQNNLAAGEIMQIDQQTLASQVRVTIAQDDLNIHTQQIANAQKVQDYLTGKFTSQQLYSWMIGQVSNLYSQLYQLAYSTAKLAEVAYQRELSVPESNYITFGYWDSLRKGLLAGDRLQLAVKQLERAYIDQNQREFEITRHVSLLLHDPAALIALKTTGECLVDLPEALFDTDYPGQYLRRLRDVSLTIPCVVGPYTSINCTLTLVTSKIRFDPSTGNGSGATGYPEKPTNQDARFIYNFGSTAAIATSHAQDDSGVFSVNFRDERYLPFETHGAVCTLMLSMPPECNAFDFDTITDVILKLSYTARPGGDLLRSQAYAAAVLPTPAQQTAAPSLGTAPRQTAQNRLFSLKHEFPNEWYGLLHPASATAAYGQMPVWTVTDRFPFQYRGRKIQVTGISAFALLQPGTTPPDSLSIYLINTSMPMPADIPPTPPGSPGTQVSLKPDTLYGTRTLYGVMSAPSSPVTVPQLWWLSIAQSDLNTVIDSVDDFFILVQYKVT